MTRIRDDRNPDGSLDDFVIDGGIKMFHLEQMDTGHWWLAVYEESGLGHHFHFTSKRRITATYEPDDYSHPAYVRHLEEQRAAS